MDYLHDREHSLACLRQAVALMARHAEVLDPLSYALWYDYAAGGSPALRRVLDAAVKEGTMLGPAQVQQLFLRHVAPPEQGAQIEALSEIADITQAVNRSTELALQASRHFGHSLARFGERLGEADASQLSAAVGAIGAVTHEAQGTIARLSDEMARHGAEIGRLRAELEAARREAAIDGLTQLLNRRAFDRELQGCLQRLESAGEPCATLILLDVDGFKGLNDRYGHAFGDKVLCSIGSAMQSLAADDDRVARFGGDEFAMLLPRRDGPAALRIGERLRAMVAASRIRGAAAGTLSGEVTISAGAAAWQRGDTPLTWLRRADSALYASKRGGRNRVTLQPQPAAATAT